MDTPKHRGRRDGWTPAREQTFLAALAAGRNVDAAAGAVGMSVSGAYRHRRHPAATSFRAGWDRALALPETAAAAAPETPLAMALRLAETQGIGAVPVGLLVRLLGRAETWHERLAGYDEPSDAASDGASDGRGASDGASDGVSDGTAAETANSLAFLNFGAAATAQDATKPAIPLTFLNFRAPPRPGAGLPAVAPGRKARAMQARVTITLKPGVLDPQGRAIQQALHGLSFAGVDGARVGKIIELDLAEGTPAETVDAMCRQLLANTVIENYRIELL